MLHSGSFRSYNNNRKHPHFWEVVDSTDQNSDCFLFNRTIITSKTIISVLTSESQTTDIISANNAQQSDSILTQGQLFAANVNTESS